MWCEGPCAARYRHLIGQRSRWGICCGPHSGEGGSRVRSRFFGSVSGDGEVAGGGRAPSEESGVWSGFRRHDGHHGAHLGGCYLYHHLHAARSRRRARGHRRRLPMVAGSLQHDHGAHFPCRGLWRRLCLYRESRHAGCHGKRFCSAVFVPYGELSGRVRHACRRHHQDGARHHLSWWYRHVLRAHPAHHRGAHHQALRRPPYRHPYARGRAAVSLRFDRSFSPIRFRRSFRLC